MLRQGWRVPTRALRRAWVPWLQALDPRSKMLLCLAGVVYVLNASPPLLLAISALAMLLLLSSRIALRQVRTIGSTLIPLIVTVLVTWPLFYSRGTDVWFAWAFVRITRDGVEGGISTALRIVALVYVLALLAATTDQARLIRALVKLGLPYVWGLTVSMALRYIPTLYTLNQTVVEAQRARAWDVPRGNPLKVARAYLPVLIAVLIGAIRLSEQTTMALTARQFDAHRPRIYYREVTFRPADWLLSALAVAALLLLVIHALD
ncbi:MAG: energy-coupling factor transporter transmembrane protein EcfT [Chloroflexi bacterium]|nr:MAG: energy-coupling factor transporter transmembrane protein EcfT [Chloroflexota bacterium]